MDSSLVYVIYRDFFDIQLVFDLIEVSTVHMNIPGSVSENIDKTLMSSLHGLWTKNVLNCEKMLIRLPSYYNRV